MNFQTVKLQGLRLADPNADYSSEQVIYLDFDGEQNVTYNNPALGLTVSDITVSDSGLTDEQISDILEDLDTTFANTGVTFTVTKPLDTNEYSTIYVGVAGPTFSEYGNFLGLAETIDAGNRIKTDNAFVFSDKIASDTALTETITHETAHLLGYQHSTINSIDSIDDFASSSINLDVSRDAYTVKSIPNSNFNNDLLSVQNYQGANEARAFIRFDISDIPDGSDILSATLKLYGEVV